MFNESKNSVDSVKSLLLDTTVSATMSHVESSLNNKQPVLLKCTKVKVSDPFRLSFSQSVLVLFDDGNTTSYISQSFVNKLKLNSISSKLLKFNVFNDSSTREVLSNLVSFDVHLNSGNTLNIFASFISTNGRLVPLVLFSHNQLIE